MRQTNLSPDVFSCGAQRRVHDPHQQTALHMRADRISEETAQSPLPPTALAANLYNETQSQNLSFPQSHALTVNRVKKELRSAGKAKKTAKAAQSPPQKKKAKPARARR